MENEVDTKKDTIKAVVATHDGGPEVLEIQDVEFPTNDNRPDFVWIKVMATAINRAE